MKKLVGMFFVMGVIALSATAAQAQATKDVQGIYEECGIGALLFPSWPVGASVSNVIWDLGTTAATSGLTTPEACKGGQARMATYIYKSYESIEQDLAKGDGKYLDMLAVLNETAIEDKDAFVAKVREEFKDVVSQDNYSSLSRVEKAQKVYDIVINQG